MTDAVEIVSDLVKIPSVSPFGRNETERRERFERCREVLAYPVSYTHLTLPTILLV